jgi:hypothetical protein
MSPELDLVHGLLDRARVLAVGLDEAAALVGPMPLEVARFGALDVVQRAAATALLKRVEQMEDVMMRLFRTLLRLEAVDTAELFNRDVANHMEKLGILPDAARWMTVVRLRNRLVHEYPIGQGEQLERTNQAYAAIPILKEALAATINRLETRPHT